MNNDLTNTEFENLLKLKRRSISIRRNTEFGGFNSLGSSLCAQKDQFNGRVLAVLTSGGDSQGMNAALRSIVRMGIYLGCKVYLIHEGYQGMVDGTKKNFELANWSTVSGIVGMGGTIIGSARCEEFRHREGRLKAAQNLIKFGINSLVCIGGDGTLTGANLFRTEWASLLQELFETSRINLEEKNKFHCLNIVGIVASIDNDFSGTDMTIGANSALHRIMESIDSIVTTALSHQRCFVLEVMGRHCGYLALSAGLAGEADWILIPENPPEVGWEDCLCKRLAYQREDGHRLNIIIVAEGATDITGKPISVEYVKSIVIDRLKIDTRITKLGHVQRGGQASAYDRLLGTRLGSEAVLALMLMAQTTENLGGQQRPQPIVIAVNGNKTCYIPLEESVEKTQMVGKAYAAMDYKRVIELRGSSFQRNLETYIKMSKLEPKMLMSHSHSNLFKTQEAPIRYRLAVLNLGAPASGVNSAIRSFVRHAISVGCKCLCVQDGFEGFILGLMKPMEWKSVYGWTGIGGSLLGCQRVDAKQVGFVQIARKIREFKIDGMVLIGGFEAFSSVCQLFGQRAYFKEFNIPMICIPATISNNIPGSHFSIGCDTALNEIVLICDKIKQSAMGSKRRVFLIETMGGYCGYLASASGLASGADASYIFEEAFTIDDLIDDIRHLKFKMEGDLKRGLLIRNEMANKNYTSQFIQQLLSEEGKGVFSARLNILGHMQQGGSPSPFDRNLGIKLGAQALLRIVEILDSYRPQARLAELESGFCHTDYFKSNTPDSAQVVGMFKNQIIFTSVEELIPDTDFEHRIQRSQWWLNMRPLIRILGKHEAMYTSEAASDGFSINDLIIEDKDENEEDNVFLDPSPHVSMMPSFSK